MDAEITVQQYLEKYEIPFKRNINIYNNHNNQLFAEFDFIIPGALIEVKNNKHKNKKIITQFKKYIDLVKNKDMKIYLIYANYNDDDDDDDELIKLIKDSTICDVIKNLDDIKDIKYNKYMKYYCKDRTLIRSLVVQSPEDYNEIKKNIKGKIVFDKFQYDYATVIMTEEEIDILKSYDFEVSEWFNTDKNYIEIVSTKYIMQNKLRFNDINYVFNVFLYKIKKLSLEMCNNEKRKPLRIIPNISIRCDGCNNIILVNSKCIKCIKCKHL